MYNPIVGRWISRDPLANSNGPEIVYSHEEVARRLRARLAPYNYVENNPVNLTDPSGLDACSAKCTGYFPGASTGPQINDKYCGWLGWINNNCCTANQVKVAKECCECKGETLEDCYWSKHGTALGCFTWTCAKKKERTCRCTIRHMSDPERRRHNCPDRVTATGETIGECQRKAKLTAPEPCRQYYGHCDFID